MSLKIVQRGCPLLRRHAEKLRCRMICRDHDGLCCTVADDGAVRQPIGVSQIGAVLHIIAMTGCGDEGELEILAHQDGVNQRYRRRRHRECNPVGNLSRCCDSLSQRLFGAKAALARPHSKTLSRSLGTLATPTGFGMRARQRRFPHARHAWRYIYAPHAFPYKSKRLEVFCLTSRRRPSMLLKWRFALPNLNL